ncbi:hypothetical protein GCM10022223_16860 [Kineosporia mesophila]|uniref:DUF1996 domain-containing protein n=1 Tax=Kineosporia mesophila TaxID=566012 RepID=A0ABP6Z8F2_9ACTN|nr:DUF1996 domain-containing protein [Kineosporia mesophila]
MSRRRPRLLRPAIALATASILGVGAAIAFGAVPGNSVNLPKGSHHGSTVEPVAGSAGDDELEMTTAQAAKYAGTLGKTATKKRRHGSTPTASPSATPSSTPAPTTTSTPTDTSTPDHAMTPGATMTMPAGDWIPVDAAAWKAQLDEFEALTPRTPPATAKKNPEFNATCTYSHSGNNDPIVFPGQTGKSHLHSFFGNESTDANSTTEDLMKFTSTTCLPTQDHSAYWMPSLTDKSTGQKVEPKELIVYYGSLLEDKTKTVPMPNGMRMVVGDAKKQEATPVGTVNQFWCAGGPADGVARSDDGNWPVCQDNGSLHFLQRFPDCWDGKNLDSPDHKSHVAYGAQGTCPAAFPVRIPAVTFVVNYDTEGTKAGFELASGMASSMHFDGFFAWDTKTMADLVKSCVNQLVTCNKEKQF